MPAPDFFNSIIVHLNQRDVMMVAISHVPLAKLEAYRKRWSFKWLSSLGSDFNFDFQVSFTPKEVTAKGVIYNFARQNPEVSEREGVSSLRTKAARASHFWLRSSKSSATNFLPSGPLNT